MAVCCLSLRLYCVSVRFSQAASLGTMFQKAQTTLATAKMSFLRKSGKYPMQRTCMTKFNDAVNVLKELPVWNQTKALRHWFLGTWPKQFCPLFLLKQEAYKEI